jgi:hypothetical protein
MKIPGILNPGPGQPGINLSGKNYPVSQHPASSIKHPVSSIQYHSIQYPATSIQYRAKPAQNPSQPLKSGNAPMIILKRAKFFRKNGTLRIRIFV